MDVVKKTHFVSQRPHKGGIYTGSKKWAEVEGERVPLMNSRFEKPGRILLRGVGAGERGRSGDKRGFVGERHERPLLAQ